MPRKLDQANIDHAIALYASGLSTIQVAAAIGVSGHCIQKYVVRAGIVRTLSESHRARVARGDGPRDRIAIPIDEVVTRYVAGESAPQIANSLGVDVNVVYKRLKRRGVAIRAKTEAGALTRQQASTKRAITEAAGQHVGWGEEVLARWLRELGEDPVQQLAIDVRNIDIAIAPIAVEVWLSSTSPTNDPYCRGRIKYLADRGWSSCYVLVARRTRTLLFQVAEQIVAIANEARANPSAHRKHWVIRGCGELAATFGDDFDEVPIMPPSVDCPHHRPGHYGIAG